MDEILKALIEAGMAEDVAKALAKTIAGLKGSGMTDEEKKELSEAKATAARILDEKKTLQAKQDEADKAAEDAKRENMSTVEKMGSDLKIMGEQLATSEANFGQAQKDLESTRKSAQMDGLVSRFRFRADLPDGMGRRELEAHTSSIDLSDRAAVDASLTSFAETHKGLIAVDVPSGSGGSQGDGDGDLGGKKDVSIADRTKELQALK